ncbi:MAG: hypothetical protein MR874_00110 [Coriobacteriaceae bacterium]|nr:hypothetical protein [Coriobacteriaceae bacterium]MCI7437772.1 hypothetical protein [Coriobacteriaceae bacterium]MDD7583500.1 hypothetical protein [Coriobacteriaceae bacterium]
MRTSSEKAADVEKATKAANAETAEKVTAAVPADTSAPRKPRAPRHGWCRALEVVAIVALIITANVLITLGFELYSSLANVMWDEYRAAANENIDTVIVGSSTGQRSFDPAVLDATLGTTTFNMATPAQELDDSYTAAKQAIKDHHVKSVILALDYESVSTVKWPGSHVAFARAKMAGESFPQAVADYWKLLTSSSFFDGADSICALFPWGYNHVELDAEHIATNFNDRVSDTTPVEAAERVMDGWTYYGNGYGNYDGMLDYSTARDHLSVSVEGPADFDQQGLDWIQNISDLCRENGVQLVVVVTPRPAYNVLAYGEKYPEQMSRLQQVVEQAGGTFLDTNLATGGWYEPRDTDFYDGEHLNHDGAARFSRAFAQALATLDAGGSASDLTYSYDQWDNYLASIEKISAVTSTSCIEGGNAVVSATAYTGSDVQVEYRFLLVDKDGATTVIQDWSASDTCAIPRQELPGGPSQVEVCARQVGSTADYERYCMQDISG